MEHMLDLSAIPHNRLSNVEKLALAEKFLEERIHTDFVFEMLIA